MKLFEVLIYLLNINNRNGIIYVNIKVVGIFCANNYVRATSLKIILVILLSNPLISREEITISHIFLREMCNFSNWSSLILNIFKRKWNKLDLRWYVEIRIYASCYQKEMRFSIEKIFESRESTFIVIAVGIVLYVNRGPLIVFIWI